MKRILAALFISVLFALAAWGGRFGPVVTDLRTTLRTTLDTTLLGYVFECPPEEELCVFIASDLADTNCDTASSPNEGWSLEAGTDATLCDNGQFNGDSPDEFSRVDRPNGFWSHDGATEIAEVVWETEFIATGAGTGDHLNMSMLASNFALICSVTIEDIAVNDPADIILVTGLANTVIGTVTNGQSLRFKMTYDPGVADECELWIDPIGVRPGTGSLGNATTAATSGLIANIISVRNMNGANLSVTKNVAVCPDGCTF